MISTDYTVYARYTVMGITRGTLHAARPPKRRAALLARRYARRRRLGFDQKSGLNREGRQWRKQIALRAMRQGRQWLKQRERGPLEGQVMRRHRMTRPATLALVRGCFGAVSM